MDRLVVIIAIVIILIVALKIYFSFKKSAEPHIILSETTLEWFELQICPLDFRFSILPEYPVTIGWLGIKGNENLVWFMSPEKNLNMLRSIINSLELLMKTHQVLETRPNEPEKAFEESFTNAPSVHFRIGYGTDGYGTAVRWQTYYAINEIPDRFQKFLEDCQKLARRIITDYPGEAVPPEEAEDAIRDLRTAD